jgi:hypothetical protein
VSVLTLLSIFLLSVSSPAGTVGTPDSEVQRLEDEVAEARNARDAELLKPGAKPTDPSVVAKERVVEEKLKSLQAAFRSRVTREKDGPTSGPATPMESFSPQVTNPTTGPVVELSGEGIQSEITYEKKSKRSLKKISPSPSPEISEADSNASPTPATNEAGVSEIQYSKKEKKLPLRPTPIPTPTVKKRR